MVWNNAGKILLFWRDVCQKLIHPTTLPPILVHSTLVQLRGLSLSPHFLFLLAAQLFPRPVLPFHDRAPQLFKKETIFGLLAKEVAALFAIY